MDWRASSFKESKQAKQVIQTVQVSLDKKAVGNLLGARSTEHRTAKLNVNTGGQERIQFHGWLYQKAHALKTLLQSLLQ